MTTTLPMQTAMALLSEPKTQPHSLTMINITRRHRAEYLKSALPRKYGNDGS